MKKKEIKHSLISSEIFVGFVSGRSTCYVTSRNNRKSSHVNPPAAPRSAASPRQSEYSTWCSHKTQKIRPRHWTSSRAYRSHVRFRTDLSTFIAYTQINVCKAFTRPDGAISRCPRVV